MFHISYIYISYHMCGVGGGGAVVYVVSLVVAGGGGGGGGGCEVWFTSLMHSSSAQNVNANLGRPNPPRSDLSCEHNHTKCEKPSSSPGPGSGTKSRMCLAKRLRGYTEHNAMARSRHA